MFVILCISLVDFYVIIFNVCMFVYVLISYRRQVKVVLEDVLQTEIGQRLLRCGGQICQKTNQSEGKRQSNHNSTTTLKDKRRPSLTKRGETDTTGPKVTSPSHNQTESFTENESCPYKEIKNPKQLNLSLKLLESSEVSDNSCSPRESDSPQVVQISEQLPKQTKPSTFLEKELSLEGSPQLEEAPSSGCESLCSPSSSFTKRSSLREEISGCEVRSVHLGKNQRNLKKCITDGFHKNIKQHNCFQH